jgi:hypothetical protein
MQLSAIELDLADWCSTPEWTSLGRPKRGTRECSLVVLSAARFRLV